MKKEKADYQPIDCNYYDELVLFAMRKKKVTINYRAEGKEEVCIESIIKDVYSKEGEEFLLLENEKAIRLDQLIAVGGKVVPTSGACDL